MSSVDVRLKDYGVSAIEVADNGGGIEPENYEALSMSFARLVCVCAVFAYFSICRVGHVNLNIA